ncbi:MAG: 50S ribosomal protein L11 [Candidatus Sungbacteria bacterium RIFCSPLOWO2_02_FULL_54_10]|uniref:Large ribosomal subunit protein uL11 n=2 Tax=Candidatus Sungiibacteriota TaxID=1817917 RepID=A0A1G2L7G1_9BACT|nr:MAG: 50S ribosomal protein L11 [Candidatus Sungbacteria bacterium RIFCSPHIGHO2_01_FULL_54_26]OHA03741.1 MAG: 50S ribosomal protein L11 [Candidatus Sungbacteria bacterium RIFCSPHIGHO2_02_FULL_53_17]OHA07585.1 MAG: 50S ribosomal protein L11 [Candidatus Sungbacteria bacterium RIFCSPLOWO2_01_FULL_54_21]OHA12421.1 MAG: 50S ribosomal protein L11 [Candidatus Sungbacteria bacterium RIFCSPLOWO2_02_FULL_54_10]
MAKSIKIVITLQIPAGKATPAPPVGTALGPHGINIGDFVKKYNDATRAMEGEIIPVQITIYEDRSFDFKLKTPPASDLLRRAAKIEKGSGEPNRKKVGKVSKADIRAIAERKMEDLNATSVEAAAKIIEGTARSMGLEVG